MDGNTPNNSGPQHTGRTNCRKLRGFAQALRSWLIKLQASIFRCGRKVQSGRLRQLGSGSPPNSRNHSAGRHMSPAFEFNPVAFDEFVIRNLRNIPPRAPLGGGGGFVVAGERTRVEGDRNVTSELVTLRLDRSRRDKTPAHYLPDEAPFAHLRSLQLSIASWKALVLA